MTTTEKTNGTPKAEKAATLKDDMKAAKTLFEALKDSMLKTAKANETIAREEDSQSKILEALKSALGGKKNVRIDGKLYVIACRKGVHYLHTPMGDSDVVELG